MISTSLGTRGQFVQFGYAAAPFASALIVLVFGAITYAGVDREADATRLVEHTHAVIEESQQMLARLVDAETGERGFVITGDSAYLDPYHGAAAEVDARLRALEQLTVDNPRQQARLDTLDGIAHRRLATLDKRITTRRTAGFDRTRAEFAAVGGGKPVMDSARRLIVAIQADERRLLTDRIGSQHAHERVVLWIAGAGAVVAALIALAISLLLSRLASNETRLARELRRRADELEGANQALQDQATEMEMLNEELQTTNERLEERTADAVEANRVKAAFLANMSHDLRTPLNAIVGYVDLLEAGVRGSLSAEQLQDLHRVKRSAAHLLALIHEVLDFAKIDSGHIQLQIREVSVESVLGELEPLVAPQVKAKGVAFETNCDSSLMVRADREKLDQILVNLVSNAIKFTDAGGHIDVVCRASGPWVQAEVRDTGEGIPSDQLDAVFAPFVQVERRLRPREQGVGLGLSISRHLARAMAGDLTVASVLGEGSTFTLRLPRADLAAD